MAAKTEPEVRWRALILDQEASGETVPVFPERRGLSEATPYWWRSRIRGGRVRRRAGLRLARVTIVPSEPSRRGPTAGAFDLKLASGHRLRVPADFEADALRRLMATRERGC